MNTRFVFYHFNDNKMYLACFHNNTLEILAYYSEILYFIYVIKEKDLCMSVFIKNFWPICPILTCQNSRNYGW